LNRSSDVVQTKSQLAGPRDRRFHVESNFRATYILHHLRSMDVHHIGSQIE
jgi:hypothetical protein